ncbi:MAG: bifunctional nuclease family protein [Spirochaetales bacterium]|nr:bifunctional nuclease family protein [Spirochaetales bacterium]
MIEYLVRGIALEKESQMPLVLLKEKDGDNILPVWIGPFEASSIIVELEGVQPPRLLTHDLLALLFSKHGFKLLRLEIYGYSDEKYLARICYKRGLRKHTVDVRPSDGISLALRLKAPVYCDHVLSSSRAGNGILGENLEMLSSEILFLEPEYPGAV